MNLFITSLESLNIRELGFQSFQNHQGKLHQGLVVWQEVPWLDRSERKDINWAMRKNI